MDIDATGTPALSTLDWSFTDANSTLTKERLRRYCEKLGSSSCKKIVLRGNDLRLSHSVGLDVWRDTWEEVEVSDNKFTSFCGDPCSQGRGTVHLKRPLVSTIAMLNTMPLLHTIRLSGNLIKGICSEGAGLSYKMNQANISTYVDSNPMSNIVWPHAGENQVRSMLQPRFIANVIVEIIGGTLKNLKLFGSFRSLRPECDRKCDYK